MCNHTSVARAVAVAALAVAFLSTGMGVNSTWAGSDQPSGLKFTPISSEGVYRSGTKPAKAWRFTQGMGGGMPSLCGEDFTCPAGYSCCKAMTASACQFQCVPTAPSGGCVHLCD
jgi:hypothetical protein